MKKQELEKLIESIVRKQLVSESITLHDLDKIDPKFISKFRPKSVLEIGGAHGILANNYQKIDDIDWTILEPNPTPVEGCKAKIINSFFIYYENLIFQYVFISPYIIRYFFYYILRIH